MTPSTYPCQAVREVTKALEYIAVGEWGYATGCLEAAQTALDNSLAEMADLQHDFNEDCE